ncbi:MAG: nickel-binding protein [Nitrososphaera sp.]
MPTYLDGHDLGNITEEQIKKPKIPQLTNLYYTENTLYNKEENKFWCVLDAHNKDAVIKHHQKDGLKCDCIT